MIFYLNHQNIDFLTFLPTLLQTIMWAHWQQIAFQPEQTFPESLLWQNVSNFQNEQQTNFILALFC